MDKLSPEIIEKIRLALEKLGATKSCPRCGNERFDILDGYFNHIVQTDFKAIHLGGPSVPTAVLVCTKCGYLFQHALGTLGLLPKEKQESEGGKHE